MAHYEGLAHVAESSTTTGTNDWEPAGAVDDSRTFASVLSNGDTVAISAYMVSGGSLEWEDAICTYNSGTGRLERTTVLESSNANAKVSFSAGTKTLVCTPLASRYRKMQPIDEDDMVSNSDVRVPTQQSVKAYVDGLTSRTRTFQTFTSSGTWTKPAGLVAAKVYVVAGGGGGGGSAGNNCGGGGGGGGMSIKYILAASLGATETVTVGAGGAAGGSDLEGSTGGTSSFGSHCSATGGAGGGRGTFGGNGGAGGLGSNGNVNLAGNTGMSGTDTTGISIRASGGGSPIGGGGKYNVATPANQGGGGGGALNGSNTQAGAAGKVWVEEFY